MGLVGAYDWSNPQLSDELLIARVLDQHRFEDMVRVCAHFGVPKVRRVFRQRVFEPMPRASVSRMLGNIAKGLKLAQQRSSVKDEVINHILKNADIKNNEF